MTLLGKDIVVGLESIIIMYKTTFSMRWTVFFYVWHHHVVYDRASLSL